MKVRVTENCLRFRLSRLDVADLVSGQCVDVSVAFDSIHRSLWVLDPTPEIAALSLRQQGAGVRVLVPARWLSGWLDDERVGFEGRVLSEPGYEVELLIEKDFNCLHRDSEQPDEVFPNPRTGS